MRLSKFWGCVAICTSVMAGCGISATYSIEDDVQQIKEISSARAKAFNEGNAADIAKYFADDALLMAPGKPVSKGTKAVEEYYKLIFDQYTTVLESHYEEVEVSGDLAYGRGEAKVTLTPKSGGASSVSTAKYLNILKRVNGAWKTTHDIWNGNE
ncbi:MAG: nuclear transport factor 2 family protein [Chitinophagaceae bacterium]|nr:nuclear transport factor 2 family protein [Chitinophagaceae bacterium]